MNADYDHDRTVTAFFDTRAAAESAKAEVIAAGVPSDMVTVVAGHEGGMTGGGTTSGMTGGSMAGTGRDEGFWGSVKNLFAPEEDKHSYAEGLSRGGYLLTAHTSEAHYDRVLDILDREGAVDMDQRETQWRSEGWSGTHAGATTYGASTAAGGYGAAGTTTSGMTSTAATAPGGTVGTTTARTGVGAAALGTEDRLGTGDGTIQLAEETLRVGKRDVNHGRVRLRSYVVEKPITETVNLHSERVDVTRRPVGPTVAATEAMFGERTLSAEEHEEEAVVSKDARVYEEVSLGKVAQDRTQEVKDTVRKTEVEVVDERTGATRTGVDERTGLGGRTIDPDKKI